MNDALNAPTIDSDVPNALPGPDQDMSASGQPTVASSPQPAQAPNSGQPPVQVVAAHPRASLFHSIMETLGGGDKTQVVIDPQTGTMSTVRTPQTSGGLAKGILAGALTGLLTGASQSSGEGTRAFGQGAQAAMQQRQQAQQQQEQKTKEDFDRQQQTKVRQAQIMKANMEAMRTAYAIGQENDEAKDKFISNHADDLSNWKNLGVIQDSGVPSDQLMKKGFDPSKYVAIPDGRVPKINPDGSRATADGIPLSQLTYSVVDATGQAPLTQDKYNKMVQYGLQRPNGTSSQIPEGATISSAVLAQMNHKIDAIDQTQAELDKVAGPGKVNLLEMIHNNPAIVDAIEKYHNDNSSTEPDVQINNMQGKFPNQAGLLRNVFGEDNLQKYKETREGRAAGVKSGAEAKARAENEPINPNNAATIINDPNATPERKLQAKMVLKTDVTFAARKAGAEAEARKAVETSTSVDDLDQLAKNIVAGDVIATMTDISSYRQSERARLSNAIVKEAKAQGKDPSEFTPAKLATKTALVKDFGSGKAADQLVAFNTFLGHADDAMTANDNWRRANSPYINKPINWLATNATNDQNFQKFQEALIPVQKEFMGFLNQNRAEHEADIKKMETVLDDTKTPAQIETSLKALGDSADIRLAQLGRKYSNTLHQAYPSLVSPEGQQALNRMGIKSRAVSAQSNQQTPQAQPAPDDTIINVDGQQQIKKNGKWIPYTGK